MLFLAVRSYFKPAVPVQIAKSACGYLSLFQLLLAAVTTVGLVYILLLREKALHWWADFNPFMLTMGFCYMRAVLQFKDAFSCF